MAKVRNSNLERECIYVVQRFEDTTIEVHQQIAQSCFGVLLIHANSDTMRQWLWKDTLNVAGQYQTDTFILHSI